MSGILERIHKGEGLNGVEAIISKLEQQRDAIERALSALRQVESTPTTAVPTKKRGRPPGRRGRMSAEGRARIAEATRKRWADKRAADAAAADAKRETAE
jgi:hypothetical protein